MIFPIDHNNINMTKSTFYLLIEIFFINFSQYFTYNFITSFN